MTTYLHAISDGVMMGLTSIQDRPGMGKHYFFNHPNDSGSSVKSDSIGRFRSAVSSKNK